MKKNSQLHLHIETELLERLKREAEQEYITVAELCRIKLRQASFSKEMYLVLKSIEKKVYSQ
ncbi:Uncharacterised protein [uncultured archaeon]|nr:Uncharacterised protein [uncultured archaeon]